MLKVNEDGTVESVRAPAVVENAGPDLAIVRAVSGEAAERELRRVQHQTAVLIVPPRSGGVEIARKIGPVRSREGRRLVVVEHADAIGSAEILAALPSLLAGDPAGAISWPLTKPEAEPKPAAKADEDPEAPVAPKRSRKRG